MSSAPLPLRPGRQTADARRESVLQAAAEEFARGGLQGTTTEAIALRAGISQPYIFRLFGSKQALFLAVVDQGFARVHDLFRRAAGGAGAADVWRAMGMAYLEMLGDRTALLIQLHTYAACEDVEVRDLSRRRFGELYEWLESLPGATPDQVNAFLARGMLLNVSAALDLRALSGGPDWAARCLQPPP